MATATTRKPAPAPRCTDAVTRPRKVVPSAHGKARLIIEINDVPYRVVPLKVQDLAVRRAFRLKKADGTAYDVAETIHGHECTCGDFTFHRDGIDPTGCKHIKAMVAWRLLPARTDGADVEADPADWPAWTDATTWAIAHTADAEQADRQARFRAATATDEDLDAFTRAAVARAVEGGYLDAE